MTTRKADPTAKFLACARRLLERYQPGSEAYLTLERAIRNAEDQPSPSGTDAGFMAWANEAPKLFLDLGKKHPLTPPRSGGKR